MFILTSKDLNASELATIRHHAQALFRKDKDWQATLLARIREALDRPAQATAAAMSD